MFTDVKEKSLVRLVFFGAAGVGKTALIQRFLHDCFDCKYKRTVEELHRMEYDIDSGKFRVEIMDTGGCYSFPAMKKLYIQNSDAFALVYSIDKSDSFEEVQRLREEILDIKDDAFVPITVVGNKLDLDNHRQVPIKDSMCTVETHWNASFLETSAKNGVNVSEVFRELLRQVNLPCRSSPALRRRSETLPKEKVRRNPPMKKANSCSIS